jgi:acetolactate decarboxylase
MKRRILAGLGLCIILFLSGCTQQMCKKNVLFQLSNLYLIKQGDFDGKVTLKELKAKGDFGLGTFDRLDGEMAELASVIYQTKSDGRVYQPGDEIKTPFAMVTFFAADKSFDIERCENYPELARLVETQLPDKDRIYAVRIEGIFDYLKLRSAVIQSKPYKLLDEALEEEAVFERKDISGTLVGFWFPAYMKELNQAGIHLHFISADKQSGGHLLEGKFSWIKVELGYIREFKMLFTKR